MLWLDHLIFGNGRGLRSPYFDDKFYWLSGRLYTWSGWFGAQLQSFQWFHPRAGEERRLAGRIFRPFRSERRWFRVRVSWSTKLPDSIDEANALLREIQGQLGETI